jgi:hypothetical protein
MATMTDHSLCLKNSNFTTCISIFLAVISNYDTLTSYISIGIYKNNKTETEEEQTELTSCMPYLDTIFS